ncbi:MAG TPA: 4a-hydroxytetrahydrobiopterin dehydratase [Rhodocyclaceae bacterium]
MIESATRLGGDEIANRLTGLGGWALRDGALQKTFSFGNYHKTMAFVNAVAWIAHRMDHHPDLLVGYNRCVVRYATHSAGGITPLDFEAAAAVESLGSL